MNLDYIKSFLQIRWIVLAARLIIGVVFIYAAWGKLRDPHDFAIYVNHYYGMPYEYMNLFSIILPGLEMAAGITMLLGIFKRATSLIIISLLIVYCMAKIMNGSMVLFLDPFPIDYVYSRGFYAIQSGIICLINIALIFGAIIAYRGRNIFALDNLMLR